MLLLIGLILILFSIVLDIAGMNSEVSEKRFRESERNAEKRHRELMTKTSEQSSIKHKRIRRVLKDACGNIIGEEIIEEY